MELYITFGIIGIGIFLFIREYFTIDTTSLLIMALFIVSGVLDPQEGFSGFIHPATVTLGCMFVISAAIFKTGIIDGLGLRIIRLARIHYLIALLVFCIVTAVLSAFINNAAVVAVMIPLALLTGKETNIPPSRLLIPIAFAASFGGACSLLGTSTNILISSYAEQSGLKGFGVFEFSVPALLLVGVGMIYLLLIAPILLPKRKTKEAFQAIGSTSENYTVEIRLEKGNPDVPKEFEQTRLFIDLKVGLVAIVRSNETLLDLKTVLLENDILKITTDAASLLRLKSMKYYTIRGLKPTTQDMASESEEHKMYEVLVPFGSALSGKSLRELGFRDVYGATVVGVRHRDETAQKQLADVKIREGDLLLIHASADQIATLVEEKLILLLQSHTGKRINYKKAIPAVLIATGVVIAAALNLTSILMSSMIGCLLLIMTSILKPNEAYDAVEWKVIFMLAGVLSMGSALEKTGGSEWISSLIFEGVGNLDHRITLSLVFGITVLSTNILSSKAAAALMTPIVISLAHAMSVSERPFLVAVMFACAFTFMTPVATPQNTMVYAPGNYRFSDFLKVGTPLNVIIWICASFVIPLFFPF